MQSFDGGKCHGKLQCHKLWQRPLFFTFFLLCLHLHLPSPSAFVVVATFEAKTLWISCIFVITSKLWFFWYIKFKFSLLIVHLWYLILCIIETLCLWRLILYYVENLCICDVILVLYINWQNCWFYMLNVFKMLCIWYIVMPKTLSKELKKKNFMRYLEMICKTILKYIAGTLVMILIFQQ